MNFKKFISGVGAFAIAASAFAGMAVTASATDTTVSQTLVGHSAIIGTGVDASSCSDNIFLNSYSSNGGAGELYFKLDDDFDATKVKNAQLGFYMTYKPNKNRSNTINFFGLSSKTTNAGTLSEDNSNDNVKVYVYGSSTTKRYVYSGTPIATYSASAYTNSAPKYGEYSYVDVTDYIKTLTTKSGGDEVYIGVSIADFAFDSRFGAYGNAHPAKLDITYTEDEQADYVINYKYNNETIKTENGTEIVGTTVNLKSSFFVEGVKYVLANNEPTSFDVASGGSTLNVAVNVAPTYSYTLNAMIGDDVHSQIASGSGYAGESVSVPYVRYILKDGTLYQNNPNSGNGQDYHKSVTLDVNNKVETVNYTATDIEDVVYLTEGEDIAGLGFYSAGNVYARASKAAVGVIDKEKGNVTITSLPAGKYQVYGRIESPNNAMNLTVALGDNSKLIEASKTNHTEFNTDEWTITGEQALTISTTYTDSRDGLDYIYVVKTGDYTPEPENYDKGFKFEGTSIASVKDKILYVTAKDNGNDKYAPLGIVKDLLEGQFTDESTVELTVFLSNIPADYTNVAVAIK